MSRNPQASLTEIDRRVEVLRHRIGSIAAKPRIQRRFETLRQQQAVVRRPIEETHDDSWQALGDLGETVDRVLGLIELEAEITAAAAAGELACDARAFTEALAAELDAWDLYLERLQIRAASMPHSQRVLAEEALRAVRPHRNALADLLAEARSSPEHWRELRPDVSAARSELDHSVDQSEVTFD